MNRLTHARSSGIKSGYWSPNKKEELVQRLAAYEDTGLSPDQIAEMDEIYAEKCKELSEEKKRCGWIPVAWHKTTDEDGIDPEEYPACIDGPMPDEGQDILVTYVDGCVGVDTFCYDDDGYYLEGGGDWIDDVLAWMPMPEAYRKEEEKLH